MIRKRPLIGSGVTVRFEELTLRIPGDEFHIRFHDQLTVLSGIGMLERQALVDSLIGSLTGAAESTTLKLVDTCGRHIETQCSAGRLSATYTDDGSFVPPFVGTLAPDAESLRTAMLLQAGDLGLTATRGRPDDPPELAEARATLDELTQEMQAALSGRQSVEGAREELARVEAQLSQAADGTAQREYARVLADLERVRAEAGALQSGNTGAETDRHLLLSADEARDLAARWSEAFTRLSDLRQRYGAADRLDADTLASARFVPDQPPSQLASMLDAVEQAREERDSLDARRRELAASRLPDPSDPRVVDLATIDQADLWTARDRVLEAATRFADEQIAMGGIATNGEHEPTVAGGAEAASEMVTTEVVRKLEAAHEAVEDAEALVHRRFTLTATGAGVAAVLGLLAAATTPFLALPAIAAALASAVLGFGAPHTALVRARRVEDDALAGAGAPTYLSFHMRRVDAAIDPRARARLDAAAGDRRGAESAWSLIARGVDIETAGRLESEVHRYATALAGMGGAADEIEKLRVALIERAEPALAAAEKTLRDACGPYGLQADVVASGDPAAIERAIGRRVALGKRARLQDALEEAEAEEEKLGNRLDDLLHQLGFRDGELDARIGALEWAVHRASEREEARHRARPREEIEEDLERLQAEARRLRRPEWASVTPKDAAEPDLEQLQQRRDELHALIASNPGSAIDLDRLSDRHSAMERRVAALESKLGSYAEAAVAQLADVHQYLLAHLTKAAHVGPDDEGLPVLLDEPFLRVAAERKWELLDMLRRLGERTQLVYLTDDPFVTAWARRRAAAGLITLLEPISEAN